MSRSLGIEYLGAFYHVASSGIEGKKLSMFRLIINRLA